MTNPFNTKYNADTMTDGITSQIKDMEVGQAKAIDTYGLTFTSFRPTLRYTAAKLGMKLKTKSGDDGLLWVMRVN